MADNIEKPKSMRRGMPSISKKLKEIIDIFKKASISKTTKNNKILIDSEEICRV